MVGQARKLPKAITVASGMELPPRLSMNPRTSQVAGADVLKGCRVADWFDAVRQVLTQLSDQIRIPSR